MPTITSVFDVVKLDRKNPFIHDSFASIEVEGAGQETVKALRKEYPFARIVLSGFIIDENFLPLDIRK